MANQNARVSIGMPAYNAAGEIEAAIHCLLTQTYRDFELIISDNASSDGTSEVCERLARQDERIRYVRQPQNLGALQNFQHVLDRAQGVYFMWAATDDRWAPFFVDENVRFLDTHPDYVASISRSSNQGNSDPRLNGAAPIVDDDSRTRLARFALYPGANCRFYSLFRREALRNIRLEDFDYLGGDWAVFLPLLRRGKFHCGRGEVGFMKGGGGASADSIRLFDLARHSWLEYPFPYLSYSRAVLLHAGPSTGALLFPGLLAMNLRAAAGYAKLRLGRWGRRAGIVRP
jgi:glycosyltransferase involved in cell wall biosynthesis